MIWRPVRCGASSTIAAGSPALATSTLKIIPKRLRKYLMMRALQTLSVGHQNLGAPAAACQLLPKGYNLATSNSPCQWPPLRSALLCGPEGALFISALGQKQTLPRSLKAISASAELSGGGQS